MINSQQGGAHLVEAASISKGMGDQFSAIFSRIGSASQYIKGDG